MAFVVAKPYRLSRLHSRKALSEALGWKDVFYSRVLAFIHRVAFDYLDKHLPYGLQSSTAIEKICNMTRAHFPQMPSYEDDWHIKVILKRYLKTAAKRCRRQRKALCGEDAVFVSIADEALRKNSPQTCVTQVSSIPPEMTDAATLLASAGGSGSDDTEGDRPQSPEYGVNSFECVGPVQMGSGCQNVDSLDHITYFASAHGHSLTVRPDTFQLQNFISYTAAKRTNAAVQRYAHLGSGIAGDISLLAEVRLTVDFGGMMDDVTASVLNYTPGNVDLILGMRWIRKHNGYNCWPKNQFHFDDGVHSYVLLSKGSGDEWV